MAREEGQYRLIAYNERVHTCDGQMVGGAGLAAAMLHASPQLKQTQDNEGVRASINSPPTLIYLSIVRALNSIIVFLISIIVFGFE